MTSLDVLHPKTTFWTSLGDAERSGQQKAAVRRPRPKPEPSSAHRRGGRAGLRCGVTAFPMLWPPHSKGPASPDRVPQLPGRAGPLAQCVHAVRCTAARLTPRSRAKRGSDRTQTHAGRYQTFISRASTQQLRQPVLEAQRSPRSLPRHPEATFLRCQGRRGRSGHLTSGRTLRLWPEFSKFLHLAGAESVPLF